MSRHYERFKEAINADHSVDQVKNLQGLLIQLDADEREAAEKDVINAFLSGRTDLAAAVKLCKYHDGNKILTDALNGPEIDYERAMDISFVLAGKNMSPDVERTLQNVYINERRLRTLISYRLWDFHSSYELFCFLASLISIDTSANIELSALAIAIMKCCGIITDPYNSDEIMVHIKDLMDLSVHSPDMRMRKVDTLRGIFR